MQASFFGLSLIALILMAVSSVVIYWGFKQIKHLEDFEGFDESDHAPSVTIIVSALNEAQTIRPALLSLLAIDYPNLSVIAMNDRSTDGTGAVLDAIANQSGARLQVIHIDALPDGWLGKNHALHCGAAKANSDYLLFTDADVLFDPKAISRAVRYCEMKKFDHLSLIFDVVAKSGLLQLLILSFSVGLIARFQPWRVATSPKRYFGVGAFNLIRRSVYVAIGGHAQNPMAVIDDIQLGQLVKQNGYRQDALFGLKSVSVEWYPSVPALIRGLEKNLFSGFEYSVLVVIAATVINCIVRVWPWIGLVALTGTNQLLCLATISINLIFYALLLKDYRWTYHCLLFMPVVAILEMFIWWRSTLLTLVRGGITWRGHFYALKTIKNSIKK